MTFETWDEFWKNLQKLGSKEMAEHLLAQGIDCVLGGIDLSIE